MKSAWMHSPTSVPADGASQITLTVIVYDSRNNPTDTRITADWPGQGRLDRVTAVPSSGMVTFTYTAGTTAGDVALRFTASNGTSTEKIVRLTAPGPYRWDTGNHSCDARENRFSATHLLDRVIDDLWEGRPGTSHTGTTPADRWMARGGSTARRWLSPKTAGMRNVT